MERTRPVASPREQKQLLRGPVRYARHRSVGAFRPLLNRVLRLVAVLSGALVLALLLSWILQANATPASPPPDVEWVVRPGDTLWDIALEYAPPGQDLRAVVWAIQDHNNLTDSRIQPGQVLYIPSHLAHP